MTTEEEDSKKQVTMKEEEVKEEKEEDKTDPTNTKRQKRPLAKSLSYQSPLVGEISLGRSWERRWQTLCMFSCSLAFIMPSVAVTWFWVLVALGNAWFDRNNPISLGIATAMAVYLGFSFVVDTSPTTGSRTPYLRQLRWWWNHSCDYLPLLLVKTAELPTNDNQSYVLGYHPHGIISVGCFGAFATDGARTMDLTGSSTDENDNDTKDDNPDNSEALRRGFSSLFPGLDRRVITLPQNFTTPFMREYFLHMGALTSDKQTFRNVLVKPNTALIVVVGGAAESLETHEGCMELVLERRRGFVREAIMANASLVPVIGFGENDLYHMLDTHGRSWISNLQTAVKTYVGFAMPIFAGRSMLLKDFGMMPQRKPVVVVVGAPIPPPSKTQKFDPQIDRKTDQPLNEHGKILQDHHAKYIAALEDLHETYKNAKWNNPGRSRRSSLKIVK
ncbi:acylglycerol O-acyltransferase 2 [Seminavis robusta]|uniref:Acyltransferase n=1 Tax=Seminavis robusta TaxID=568900 RepID=A0A9N8DPZ3_9STRA|nr:acylglycerol O-acyltransferase 2 [Seminavis robusta]|eukprot:Sro269_g104040.1 acylglycerol O-acyltransferase 2 (446) ;mRNA; r:50408-51745